VIAHTGGPASITFGELDGRASPRAKRLLDCCEQADIEAELSASIKRALWAKLAFICAQAGLTAAVRLPIGEIRAAPAARAASDLGSRAIGYPSCVRPPCRLRIATT
jgi:2-dehydropantoate 2-reductase